MKTKSNVKLFSLLLVALLVLVYFGIISFSSYSLKKYDQEFFPNTYLGEFDLSHYTFDKASIKLNFYEEYLLSQKVRFVLGGKKYSYSLSELGVTLDVPGTIEQVQEVQNKISFGEKLEMVFHKDKKEFPILYHVDESVLKKVLVPIQRGRSSFGDQNVKLIKSAIEDSSFLKNELILLTDVSPSDKN